ncbi:MAG: S26 family signal peptidase [Planctomycetota bacterium]
MANTKKRKKHPTAGDVSEPSKSDGSQQPTGHSHAIRESIESIVIAFVLAFLFRTFEAEAFIIPTGSMSPSLLGQHKDVNCTQCGHRFRVTASSEDPEEAARRGGDPRNYQVVGGVCPMCRYTMPFQAAGLPPRITSQFMEEEVDDHRTYPGDRILVNKYGFGFEDPARWDVVVFKFPGNGDMNYIKRLVGLSNEELQVYQGDVFTRPLDDPDAPFVIERKPPDKVAAMLQLVHDSDHEAASLHDAGWPLRWAATTPDGWQSEVRRDGAALQQEFSIRGDRGKIAWLRYRHLIPDHDVWQAVKLAAAGLQPAEEVRDLLQGRARPELITDFNPYNARILRGMLAPPRSQWRTPGNNLGVNWVGDLAVACDVEVEKAQGELMLDVVEAGYHFRCTIDLSTGAATLGIVDGRTGKPLDFSAMAATPVSQAGSYTLRFANVDDQLLLWVDGRSIEFDVQHYDPDQLLGGRSDMIPWASEDDDGDQGDLSPVGIGALNADLNVSRLQVFRDIYYIATSDKNSGAEQRSIDYPSPSLVDPDRRLERIRDPRDLFAVPENWERFRYRRKARFEIGQDQYFVMGDNSPESKDCRLWREGDFTTGIPGGAYLDRRLLIGKAVCVFWPHSWGGVPGLQRLPGWPNFGDMRLVR